MVPFEKFGKLANSARVVADPEVARRIPGHTLVKVIKKQWQLIVVVHLLKTTRRLAKAGDKLIDWERKAGRNFPFVNPCFPAIKIWSLRMFLLLLQNTAI